MKKKIRRNKRDKDGYEYNFDGLDPKHLKPAHPPAWFPSPEEVAKMLENAKVTILLDQSTLDFFKREAKKRNANYQQMIRDVLHDYVHRHSRRAA